MSECQVMGAQIASDLGAAFSTFWDLGTVYGVGVLVVGFTLGWLVKGLTRV